MTAQGSVTGGSGRAPVATPPDGTAAPDSGVRAPGIALLLIVAFQLCVVLDTGAVNVALPRIRDALGFSPATVSWVVNAQMIAFGGLLLLGGRLGDLYGRRRIFRIGVILFSAGSLLAGLAPAAWWMVVARAIEGVGAAIATPTALALLVTTFSGPARNRALGIYASVSGIGGAIGLLTGGLFTGLGLWRGVLFVVVPIGALVALFTSRYLPEAPRRPGRLDLPGALTSTAGMAALTFGLVRAASRGWEDPVMIASLAVGVALLVAFPLVETRVREPLLPLRLLGGRRRPGAYAILLLLAASMMSQFFFLVQFLQDVRGFSPLQTGLAFLPMSATTFVSSRVAGGLATRIPMHRLMVTGAVAGAAGMLWLTAIGPGTTYASGVLGPLMLFGVGLGVLLVTATATGVSGVSAEHSGTASSLVHVAQRLGGAVGLAVLVTVFGTTSANAAAGGAGKTEAMTSGISAAFAVGVGFTVVVLLLALLVVGPERDTSR